MPHIYNSAVPERHHADLRKGMFSERADASDESGFLKVETLETLGKLTA
jgi:hypothetical protein